MITVFKNIVTADEIKILLEYVNTDDDRVESRPDVRSKHPRWGVDVWPETLVRNIIDRVLTDPWSPEYTVFMESRLPGQGFRLHVDSSNGQTNLYKNVLIPLFQDGPGATVFFKNYWHGASTRFSKTPNSPFSYPLVSKQGVVMVPDIRTLLDQCKSAPKSVENFDVTESFVSDLERLVWARSGNGLGIVDRRTSDYSQIDGYDSTLQFDPVTHQQYLSHIDIENLHGLTVDQIVNWEIGSVIVFPRSQIHCAAATHSRKIGLSVFTDRRT